MRYRSRDRPAVSSIVGSIFFVLIMIVAIASLVTMFNSFTSYNQQVNKVSNTNQQKADTQLSITSGQFGAFPPSTTSNFNVATSCAATPTASTNEGHLFYAAGMWWDFYACNSAFQYSTSYDGVTWQAATSVPSLVTGYTVGPYWDINVVGTTIYIAIAKTGSADFQLGIGTLAAGGTDSAPAGTISWQSAPAQVATTASVDTVAGAIQVDADSSGNVWVATVQGTTAIGVYERQVCTSGTSAADGWEPNACSSATAPTNYAPTALGTLSANANMILAAAPSTLSTVGVVMIYETGSATVASTGTPAVITEATLATTTWNTISISTPVTYDYSLTASSAVFVSNTLYFAGLASATAGTAGSTTGGVRFWSVVFTSMTAGTASSDATSTNGNPIESTAESWSVGLTSSGTTLVLFDNPPTGVDTCSSSAGTFCVQYYSTATLGSLWSSAILLVSGESAVTGLDPSGYGFAVTWGNSTPNVRFSALSMFTASNASPFGIHLVDIYIYNPSTNVLVAHWYYNTTGTGAEDFDYWVGQGATMVIPIRFIWAASTSYLVTLSTDQGVTAQTTQTTLPGGLVSCPSGQFYYELSPTEACTTAPGDTNPVVISGAGAETCTDSATSAEYTGFALSYTTSSSTSGNIFVSFSFQVASPATTTLTSAWRLYYGSSTAPTCEAVSSYSGSGTALGETYTVESQAGVVRELTQSVATTISGLAPSTTYWFDLQVTDSSTGSWIYSNPSMTVVDQVSSNSPLLATYTSTASCTITATTTPGMAALAATFTTGASSTYSGTVFGQLSFNIAETTTASATNTAYIVHYGTGTAPTCHATAAGTATGETYTFTSQSTTIMDEAGQSVGFVLSGLSASTTYWVDVEETDSSATPSWIYSNPTLATMDLPNAGTNSLPNAVTTTGAPTLNTNANTCSDTTQTTGEAGTVTVPFMAGFGVEYKIPSTATGNLLISLTFGVTVPGTTTGDTSQWLAAYNVGATPTCGAPGTGIPIGGVYAEESESASHAGGLAQTTTFVLKNVQNVAGQTIWIDVQMADSNTDTWTYLNPSIAVVDFPA